MIAIKSFQSIHINRTSKKIILAVLVAISIAIDVVDIRSIQGKLKENHSHSAGAQHSLDTSTSSTSSLPLCSIDQIHEGRWVPKILQPNEIPYRTSHMSKACVNNSDAAYYEGAAYSRVDGRIQSFEWIPHSSQSCFFEKWSTDSFCQALTNNNSTSILVSNNMENNYNVSEGSSSSSDIDILIVGDSLSQEQYKSLVHLLDGPQGTTIVPVGKYHEMTHKCGIRVLYRRLDRYSSRERLIISEMRNRNPTYALLNFGAHYLPDKDHGNVIQRVANDAREWQKQCKLMNKKCLLIWRTTVPGHPNCNWKQNQYPHLKFLNWTLPFAEERLVDGFKQFEFGDEKWWLYHWHEFGHQNENALAILQASGIDFVVMDAYRINILRPDGHPVFALDCLHSCLGSKTDVYSQLLLHIIKLHKQGLLVTR